MLTTKLLTQIAYALGVGVMIGLERSLVVALSGPTAVEAGDPNVEDVDADENKDKGGEGGASEGGKAADAAGEEAVAPAAEDATAAGDATREEPQEYVGVRTFAILSLVGYAAALIGDQINMVPVVTLAVIGFLVIGMYFRAAHFGHGITTEAAAIGVCALGMLCRFQPQAAGVLAVLITIILASKRFTHATIARMRRVELTDTLKFLVVILIVLPLLPNRPLLSAKFVANFGATATAINEGFNPYKVGLLVVLISGISYVGYFLTRVLGAQRGLALTGIVGGLTSSTAVTAAMANEAKARPEWRFACVVATLAANATMFARVLVVVAVLDLPLFYQLTWPVGGMGLTAMIVTGVLWFKASKVKHEPDDEKKEKVKLKNPFSVGPALKFAGFFVFIKIALKLSKIYLGSAGLYATAAVSGLADVDAITLELSGQAHSGETAVKMAALGITIAVVSNSVTKSAIAITTGGWGFGKLVALGLGLATVVGLTLAVVV